MLARSPVVIAAALAAGLCACGSNVNLGGTLDGGTIDAGPGIAVDICEPCDSAQSCPVGATCAQVVGTNRFCATECPGGTECDADHDCKLLPLGNTAETVRACVPKAGACQSAKPPISTSPTPVEHCGPLEAPSIVAGCKSCDKFDSFCQKNGCYGGWWCSKATNKCQKPPASCP